MPLCYPCGRYEHSRTLPTQYASKLEGSLEKGGGGVYDHCGLFAIFAVFSSHYFESLSAYTTVKRDRIHFMYTGLIRNHPPMIIANAVASRDAELLSGAATRMVQRHIKRRDEILMEKSPATTTGLPT